MFRNLMAMDVEEMIRAQPMDAVVLVGGCDKTVPAQLMGAASAGRPAIQLVAGPMMTGRHQGERLGACTDCRRFWAQYRAGEVSDARDRRHRGQPRHHRRHLRGHGHGEHHGLHRRGARHGAAGHGGDPRGACRPPARRRGDGRARRSRCIRRRSDARPGSSPRNSVENALRVLLAIGGSTNAIIHLTAIAGRAGMAVSLKRLNELSDTTPVLVNLKPVGNGYMEDFFAAGGMGALLRELRRCSHLDCLTVTGETLGERLDAEPTWSVDRAVMIRAATQPIEPQGGLVALFGSLAPRGAILKRSAADPKLFEHEGRAVVFTSLEDLAARIDDPDLDVTPDDFLVLQNAGPRSGRHARSRLPADPGKARARRASRTWCASPTRA